MSYCRWSCDDFECDLYCYSDVSGGWTIHVAANRHVGKAPSVASAFDKPFDGVRAAALYKAQSDWLEFLFPRWCQVAYGAGIARKRAANR